MLGKLLLLFVLIAQLITIWILYNNLYSGTVANVLPVGEESKEGEKTGNSLKNEGAERQGDENGDRMAVAGQEENNLNSNGNNNLSNDNGSTNLSNSNNGNNNLSNSNNGSTNLSNNNGNDNLSKDNLSNSNGGNNLSNNNGSNNLSNNNGSNNLSNSNGSNNSQNVIQNLSSSEHPEGLSDGSLLVRSHAYRRRGRRRA